MYHADSRLSRVRININYGNSKGGLLLSTSISKGGSQLHMEFQGVCIYRTDSMVSCVRIPGNSKEW